MLRNGKKNKKITGFILGVLFLCVLTGCASSGKEADVLHSVAKEDLEEKPEGENQAQVEQKTDSSKEEEDAGKIFVYVCGQVQCPGVYELSAQSRIYEALEAAGGMTESAAQTYLNQAECLEDGVRLYVPTKEEAKQLAMEPEGQLSESGKQSGDGKVNLNKATEEELMTLSGIGEVKAKAIIRYREEQGGFQSIENLKEIEGIKDGVFNKVKDQICI